MCNIARNKKLELNEALAQRLLACSLFNSSAWLYDLKLVTKKKQNIHQSRALKTMFQQTKWKQIQSWIQMKTLRIPLHTRTLTRKKMIMKMKINRMKRRRTTRATVSSFMERWIHLILL